MQVLLLISGLFYVAVMPVLFISWLEFFHQDQDELTEKEQHQLVFVTAIASLFWILVLPFAYIELLDKFKQSNRLARLYEEMLEASKLESSISSEGT